MAARLSEVFLGRGPVEMRSDMVDNNMLWDSADCTTAWLLAAPLNVVRLRTVCVCSRRGRQNNGSGVIAGIY